MSDYSVANITFHSPSRSRIEWLREKFMQTEQFCCFEEYQDIIVGLLPDFFDMTELKKEITNYCTIDSIMEIFERNGEYAFEIITYNHNIAPFDFWPAFSKAIDIEYAMCDENVEWECGIIGDPDAIWYPESCKIDYWEDEEKVFNKVEDMVEYLKTHHPDIAPENVDDTDEWNEVLRDEDIGAVRVYDRKIA